MNLMIKTRLTKEQSNAVEKLSRKKVNALFMNMGKGKSLVIIKLFLQRLLEGKVDKMVILLPLSTKDNFSKELIKHIGYHPNNVFYFGIESISLSDRIYIDALKLIDAKTFLVIDESTKVKNILATRTERTFQLSRQCNYKLIASGTPITKYVKDLYSQFLILSPNILGYRNYEAFKEHHLQVNRITGEIVGSSNVDYLQKLIAPFTYYSFKDKLIIKRTYIKKHYKPVNETLVTYEAVESAGLRQFSKNWSSIAIMSLLTTLQTSISDGNRIKALLEIIEKHKDEKIIIFCKYTNSINDIYNTIPFSSVILNGENKDIRTFISGNTRVLIANIAVAALGLNLQCANVSIFYENSFDYALRLQSEARTARKGQMRECFYYDIDGGFGIEKLITLSIKKKKTLLEIFKEGTNYEKI